MAIKGCLKNYVVIKYLSNKSGFKKKQRKISCEIDRNSRNKIEVIIRLNMESFDISDCLGKLEITVHV